MGVAGRVAGIYLYPASRCEPVARDEVRAEPGGLVGDRARTPQRQVTILTTDGWAAATAEAGATAPPSARRANLVVSGIALPHAIGTRLRVGEAVIEILGETEPCRRMEEVSPGLRAALKPDRRAGVFGAILSGGLIRVGDPVE